MNLNLGSISFNMSVETGGNTPAWGTELGQDAQYKFKAEIEPFFFQAMTYSSIPIFESQRNNTFDKAVFCPLGKGGNAQNDYEYVQASLFKKIFVTCENHKNGPIEDKPVDDCSFLLLIVKLLNGNNHVGRRTLKYNKNIQYHGNKINDDCFQKVQKALGLNNDAAWFIDEINLKNQDELHFVAYIVNENEKVFRSPSDMRQAMLDCYSRHGNKKTINYIVNSTDMTNDSLQQIFYGAPGTGKSHKVKRHCRN